MQPAPDSSNRDARIRHIFLDAAELETAQREEFLQFACSGDGELRREVERLLVAYDDNASPFARSIPGAFIYDRTERQTYSAGDKVDRFVVKRLLGVGGMGEVYEVTDSDFGGQFALKTLRREFARRPEYVARFKREIQLARRITHPNVCRIYEPGFHQGENGNICFLTMELLEGRTLAQRVREGPIELASALSIFCQLASGVAALHAGGIVHRDIKPANVILVATPTCERAVITDFGVAHPLLGADEDLTFSGQIIGTVRYMAPEQHAGKKVGPEADVYSLGIVMYEVFRGHQREVNGTWHEHVTRDFQQARESADPGVVERRLFEIIERCLEPDPKIRFRDASEIVAWLGRIDEQRGGRTWHWPFRRHRRWVQPADRPQRQWRAAIRHARAPIGAVLAMGAAAAAWPAAKPVVLQRACRALPGNALVCEMPTERDIAVLPFRITAVGEQDSVLANGYAQFIRLSLTRLYPDPGKLCLHPRSDTSSDGVRLVLESEIHPNANNIEFNFTVRDTWAAKDSPSILRTSHILLPLNSTERLYEEPLRQLLSALEYKSDPEVWRAWTKGRPESAAAFTAYLRGLGHLQAEQYERAIAAVNEAVDPSREFEFAPAHAVMARAYRLWSNRGENVALAARARQAAERASALDPEFDFGRAERELGDIESGLRHADEAVRHYSAALRSWPFDDAAVKALAAALEMAGRDKEAENTFAAAVTRAPRCWLNYNTLADFYSRHGRYSDAERTLLEAVRYSPRNSAIYHNLAFDYTNRGRFDAAIRMAAKSIELNPAPSSYSTLGRAYLLRNCRADALVNLRYALTLDPEYYILWANLGDALAGSRSSPESRQVFQRVVETSRQTLVKSPGHLRARLQLALNLARLDQVPDAMRELEKALPMARSSETLLQVVKVYELTGRRKEALQTLEQAFDAGLKGWQVQVVPDLAIMRNAAQYQQLLLRRGISTALDDDPQQAAGPACPGAAVPGKAI